jgi:dihydropteroate synthase type 2
MHRPHIVGIVNITEDSFSDGGKYLSTTAAIERCRKLLSDGAEIIDLGPAASNPDAKVIGAEEEIRRLDPVLSFLKNEGAAISVDSFLPATQRYAMSRGVAFLNDIQGFPDRALYAELASHTCKLIVMHAVQERAAATRMAIPATEIWDRILRFFEQRVAALTSAGIAQSRLILDPGMGYFLSSKPDASLRVLANLSRLKQAFGLAVLVSVSRKSFLRAITGRDIADVGAATVAAELYAAVAGADYLRTHEAGALRDALRVIDALATEADSAPSLSRGG